MGLGHPGRTRGWILAEFTGCLGLRCGPRHPLPHPLSQVDRLVALSRMRQSGAFLSTSEGLILQLMGDAAHPQFKEVLDPPTPDLPLLPLKQQMPF